MTFTKDFPELAEKYCNDAEALIWTTDIQHYCLNKTNVKEAIIEIRRIYDSDEYTGNHHWALLLLEKLGLKKTE